MKVTLLCVGKAKEDFIQDGVAKYLRFLRPYAEVGIREVKEEKVLDLKEAPVVRKRESEKIRKALPAGAMVVALDERGREFTSHEFAEFLNMVKERGARELVFIIGGALGLDEGVTERSDRTIALSRWTMTHEMARLVFLEQLYRAFTIITGKTYHY